MLTSKTAIFMLAATATLACIYTAPSTNALVVNAPVPDRDAVRARRGKRAGPAGFKVLKTSSKSSKDTKTPKAAKAAKAASGGAPPLNARVTGMSCGCWLIADPLHHKEIKTERAPSLAAPAAAQFGPLAACPWRPGRRRGRSPPRAAPRVRGRARLCRERAGCTCSGSQMHVHQCTCWCTHACSPVT